MLATVGIVLAIALVAVGVFFARYFRGGFKIKPENMSGKVCIVTGSNTGLGLETAKVLYSYGATVIMACRDVQKAEQAKNEVLKQELVFPNTKPQAIIMKLDLTSLDSVREFVANFEKTGLGCHVLINNAGVMAPPYMQTKDGFELQFGVNHLGHFLLTNLLLKKVIPDTAATSPVRIISVSSHGHAMGFLPFNNLNSEKFYNKWLAYGQSKLNNILFQQELNNRCRTGKYPNSANIFTYSLHPGVVNTELIRYSSSAGQAAAKKYFITPNQGAQTQLNCAVNPQLASPEFSGLYWSNGHPEVVLNWRAYGNSPNNENSWARKLWDLSVKLTKSDQ